RRQSRHRPQRPEGRAGAPARSDRRRPDQPRRHRHRRRLPLARRGLPVGAPGASVSRVTLPILDACTLTAACTQILAEARAGFERLAALPLADATPASVLDEWDRLGQLVENIEGPVSILNNVHPDKAVRDAADEAVRQLAAFQVEIFQNEALFE